MRLSFMIGWVLLATAPLPAQQLPPPAHQEHSTMAVARGTFEVKMGSLPSDEFADAAQIGRMSIDKTLHGDIEGSSKGMMLATGSPTSGSAGYVAIERVTGTLQGKRGAFALQHSAWMAGGEQGLTITVVPGSGTEELAGLQGTFLIIITGKDHAYEFTYSLPDAR
ncbi:MAG: DUF3224 domain-containing protein [Gemmatimonadota bacterium]